MTTARERYNQLSQGRSQFLTTAVECSELTLPYLVIEDTGAKPSHKKLETPWQSVGSKCVVNLAAKLMLALVPPQTTFFKLQVKYLISNKVPIPPKKVSVSTFVCGSNRNNITSISL